MTRPRLTIAQAMAIVFLVGFGCAALRNANDFWAIATFNLAIFLNSTALVAAIVSRGRARARSGVASSGPPRSRTTNSNIVSSARHAESISSRFRETRNAVGADTQESTPSRLGARPPHVRRAPNGRPPLLRKPGERQRISRHRPPMP